MNDVKKVVFLTPKQQERAKRDEVIVARYLEYTANYEGVKRNRVLDAIGKEFGMTATGVRRVLAIRGVI